MGNNLIIVDIYTFGPGPRDFIAYWPLDGDILDKTGNGRNMTMTGSLGYSPGRNGGYGISFTAGNSLQIPSLNLATGTISCWIYVRTTGTQKILRSDNGVICFGQNAGVWEACGPSGTAVVLNTWLHLAIVHGVGAYINGVLVIASLNAATNSITNIGGPPFSEWFNGVIDDVKWYSRALSLSEVRELASN